MEKDIKDFVETSLKKYDRYTFFKCYIDFFNEAKRRAVFLNKVYQNYSIDILNLFLRKRKIIETDYESVKKDLKEFYKEFNTKFNTKLDKKD